MVLVKRALAAALILCMAVLGAAAETTLKPDHKEAGVAILSPSIGYNGLFTYSRPMPLRAVIDNRGDARVGTLAVNVFVNQEQFDRYEMQLTLEPKAQRQVTIPVRIGFRQSEFTIEWVEEGQTVASAAAVGAKPVNPSSFLVGTLTDDPSGLHYLNISKDSDDLRRGEFWQTLPLTQDTFPSDLSLLSSIDLLVVDRFDASLLSKAQMRALDGWLADGGILVLGGGADAGRVYPAFCEETGCMPGSDFLEVNGTRALAEFVGAADASDGKETLVCSAQGRNPLLYAGDTPLLFRSAVGKGVIYTAAFSWSDKTISAEPMMHTFLQRLLLRDAPEIYQTRVNQEQWNSSSYWNMDGLARSVKIENRASAVPMLALLAAYVLLGGVGGYFLLKKLDKREWTWVLFPVLTVLCLLAVARMGSAGKYSEPMAVTFTRYDLTETGEPVSVAAVSVSDGKEHRISAPGRSVEPLNADSYYYYYDDDQETIPGKQEQLRYRYCIGADQSVGVGFGAAWNIEGVRISNETREDVAVSASVWPVENGLRGEVVNNSAFSLRGGIVFTPFGFCTVGDLLPGEKTGFSLTEKEDNKDRVFSDGVYVRDTQDYGYYSLISACAYPADSQEQTQTLSKEEMERRDGLYALLENAFVNGRGGYDQEMNRFFRFVAFNDELDPVSVRIDGRNVERVAHKCAVVAAVEYSPYGEQGRIYFAPGTLPPFIASAENGRPVATESEASGREDGYRMADYPMFCFSIPDFDQINVSKVQIACRSYYAESMLSYVYDFNERAWAEFKLGIPLNRDEIPNYIREGKLFVMFEPVQNSESYYSLFAPSIELEGTVK